MFRVQVKVQNHVGVVSFHAFANVSLLEDFLEFKLVWDHMRQRIFNESVVKKG